MQKQVEILPLTLFFCKTIHSMYSDATVSVFDMNYKSKRMIRKKNVHIAEQETAFENDLIVCSGTRTEVILQRETNPILS